MALSRSVALITRKHFLCALIDRYLLVHKNCALKIKEVKCIEIKIEILSNIDYLCIGG